jgi:hypothetical protein
MGSGTDEHVGGLVRTPNWGKVLMDSDASFSWTEAEKDLMEGIDTTIPHSARIWNYWLGGKDNYPADRLAGDEISKIYPDVIEDARAVRAFLSRAVIYLAGTAGVRQFLDIGTGLPTANNTHQIAQSIAADSRIVYVDHDPLVLAHARALLVGTPQGATDYIHADLREPHKILREAARTLDFTQPIAITLFGILGHITENDEAYAIVRRLLGALCSGSHLAISDLTNVVNGEVVDEVVRRWNLISSNPRVNRTPEEIARFFDGLELLEPGVVSSSLWRPDPTDPAVRAVDDFGGVGRKP